MLAKGGGQVVYLVVVVEVDGIRCSTLLDMGAGSFYTSAALISKLNSTAKRVRENWKNDDADKSEDKNVQGPSL